MRIVRTFLLRLLVDPAEPDVLRGALRPMPKGEAQPFADEKALLALLRQMSRTAREPVQCREETEKQPEDVITESRLSCRAISGKELPMEHVICCVCEKPIEGQSFQMGNRPYCAACYTKVTGDRRGLWWASLIGVAGLIVFVVLVALVAGLTRPHLEGLALAVVGLILALVPAIIWLAIFYAQDVREPEPKRLVLGVFLLGALLAQAVGNPLVEDVFRVSQWMTVGPLYHILAAILIVGFTEQFLVYAAVRYSIYGSPEFDERIDGIIYGTAAALGYATVLNVGFVVRSGGLDLVAGVIRIAVTALALASFGGLVGYFLGRCKFEDEPLWWMPAGLALAAVLDGLFIYVRGEITTTAVGLAGGGYNPWPGLILGAAVAGITFGALFYLIGRLRRGTSTPAEA